jgi:hypothetical protein
MVVRTAVVAVVGVMAAAAATEGSRTELPAWLAGCWELRQGGRRGVEMWMPPDGGMMLGASRTTVSGQVREYEQLRLDLAGDTLVYTATPSGQAAAAFRSTDVTESGFTVANPAHDFPQRIGYRRHGADSLTAWIEGPGKDGIERIEYPMRRMDCRG